KRPSCSISAPLGAAGARRVCYPTGRAVKAVARRRAAAAETTLPLASKSRIATSTASRASGPLATSARSTCASAWRLMSSVRAARRLEVAAHREQHPEQRVDRRLEALVARAAPDLLAARERLLDGPGSERGGTSEAEADPAEVVAVARPLRVDDRPLQRLL